MKTIYNCSLFILIICFFSGILLAQEENYSSTEKFIEEVNEYGGITIERINNNLFENNNWLKAIEYYDDNNNLIKTVVTLSNVVTNETGLLKQIEYYDGDKIIRYEMFFSEEFRKKHDFNRAVEIIGENKTILRTIWFVDDTAIDVIDYPQNMNAFEFLNINIIKNELLIFYDPNSERDISVISARYVYIRSLIKFDTELIQLDETDYYILSRFSAHSSISPNYLNLFKKKVRVYHDNNCYWFFVHSQLEQHINGQYATISYVPQLWNGELYTLGIGLFILE